MADEALIRWLRRGLSTVVMMSVFFVAFLGGFSLFLYSDFMKVGLSFVYVLFGLFISWMLWT